MGRRPIKGSYNAQHTRKPFYITVDYLNRATVEQLISYSIIYNMCYAIKNGAIVHYTML